MARPRRSVRRIVRTRSGNDALRPGHGGQAASAGRDGSPTLPDMSRTNFLALVVAILFLLAAVSDLAVRPDNWVAMLAVALAGALVSMTVGIVSRRRAQAA